MKPELFLEFSIRFSLGKPNRQGGIMGFEGARALLVVKSNLS